MGAGLLIAVPAWFFGYAALTDWMPHKIIPVTAIGMGIVGFMWLYDELSA